MIHGFGGSETVDRGSHLVIRTPSNPHFWWGNYLLLRSAPPAGEWQGWIAEFAREFPSARHVALGLDSVDGAVEDAEGLTALGFDIQVDTVLTATDLPRRAHKRPLFEIRPLHSDEDWAQSVELRLSLHEGAPDPRLPKRAQTRAREYRAVVEAGHGVWFGAFVDGVMRCGAGLFTDDSGLPGFRVWRLIRPFAAKAWPPRWFSDWAGGGSPTGVPRSWSLWRTRPITQLSCTGGWDSRT